MSTEPVTRLTVGYLATPSGDDGVALAVAIAGATGASIDLVCVVHPVEYDGTPGLAGYQERLENQAAEWLADGAGRIPEGIDKRAIVTVHDSFTGGLVEVAEQSGASMIVVGGTGDGLLRRHTLGTISTELLHSSPLPVALAPRGYADRATPYVDMVTVAVPVRTSSDNPLPFAVGLARQAQLDLRLLSLVSSDDPTRDDTERTARDRRIAAAEQLLAATRESVGTELDVDSLVADGPTLDEALDKLPWDEGDIVAVGSGHLGRPNRVFLGSTAARILRWTTAPVVVTPRS
ncbi:universal stress protein [Gordonia soli]|uniref:UspA domain-containing protein n=1 Tax=Gordonia soli NBRC 108243 TaxID=1223545 RepID=M0QQX8_9ACTN|nr:universal stress protein [Gordonia soli]GAC69827.1 hypothetical protein GS4_28_00760 [Gordonia soli NBRC 108243]